MKIGLLFVLVGFFLDAVEDEAMRGGSCTLGRARGTARELFGQAGSGGGHALSSLMNGIWRMGATALFQFGMIVLKPGIKTLNARWMNHPVATAMITSEPPRSTTTR